MEKGDHTALGERTGGFSVHLVEYHVRSGLAPLWANRRKEESLTWQVAQGWQESSGFLHFCQCKVGAGHTHNLASQLCSPPGEGQMSFLTEGREDDWPELSFSFHRGSCSCYSCLVFWSVTVHYFSYFQCCFHWSSLDPAIRDVSQTAGCHLVC